MSQKTSIEWTDTTWNPVRGCSRISEGCRNCYAEQIAARFSGRGGPFQYFADRFQPGSKWTGKVELIESKLQEPLHWRKPRKVFVNSMSDLFHENLPDEAIDRIFAVMALCPQHTFQVLTKRAKRMRRYFAGPVRNRVTDTMNVMPAHAYTVLQPWPLPNVWLGVSIESRAHLDRADWLHQTSAAIRFLSLEPLLEDLDGISGYLRGIDWVIAGGESGPGARLNDPAWFRSIRDQCQAARIPFFFKQWGGVHKKDTGAILDGREWREFPRASRSARS